MPTRRSGLRRTLGERCRGSGWGYRHALSQDKPVPPPPTPQAAGRGAGRFEAGGYTPGEQVALAAILTRVTADENGRICLTIPAALRPLVGDVVAIGEESREVYLNQAGIRVPAKDTWLTALNEGTPAVPPLAPPAGPDPDLGLRRGGPEVGM